MHTTSNVDSSIVPSSAQNMGQSVELIVMEYPKQHLKAVCMILMVGCRVSYQAEAAKGNNVWGK